MSVTNYVALPFIPTEEVVAPGQAQECPNERAALRPAEAMSRKPPNAVEARVQADRRREHVGNFEDAPVLKKFGEVPSNLDEL